MRKETRQAFRAYQSQVAKLNGADDATEKFNVEPSVHQKLETAIQESNALLGRINIIGVDEQTGEALQIGVNGPVASRTNTKAGKRRNPGERHKLTKDSYACVQTNFDTSFLYATVDQWAKFPDFQVRLSNAIVTRQGLDRITIGFHGKEAAAETDIEANPMLEDVNIGWLEKIRTKAPDRVLEEGVADSGKIVVGKGGDYKTLDGIVFDAVQLLEPWHRNHPDLVVLVSRGLLHAKLLKAVEKGGDSNVEENAAQEVVSRARLGGLPIVDAPFFPEGTILITTLANLSIYWQEKTRRRLVRDEPDYDRIADYQSVNEAYVVEDFGLVALVENIERAPEPDDEPAAEAAEG